jgi:molybdopterin synthase sulfur carrier subunit
MEIRLRYFASLREITGRNEETLTVPEGTRITDVRDLLQTRYPALQSVIERCISAVNRSYVPAETTLHEHDEVVFIPPMGGGAPADNTIQARLCLEVSKVRPGFPGDMPRLRRKVFERLTHML